MKLLTLKLKNFKGIRDFTLDIKGEDAEIKADNAKGKTTIADAYQWLLFGRDSQNRADFNIKTLDASGKAHSGLDHEVEAVFHVGEGELTLRRVYAEKWTKKRGSADAEFSGHTTDYYIDGVPMPEKDYKARVAAIADEQVFRLLSDPYHFNRNLTWQQRRKLLLDVCGDISDAEVIVQTPVLSDLPAILGRRTLDDHRKVIQARRAEINKELDKLPVRIDEVERGLPAQVGADAEQTLADIITTERNRGRALERRIQTEQGGGVAEKTKQLREAEAAALDLETQARRAAEAGLKPLREQEAKLLRAQAELTAKLQGVPQMVLRHQEALVRLENLRAQLRAEWHRINNEIFTPSAGESCPTCGQALPEEAVCAANQKVLAEFNRSKAQRLEQIAVKGKAAAVEAEDRQRDIDVITAESTTANQRLAVVAAEIQTVKQQIDAITHGAESGPDPRASIAHERVAALKAEIDALRQGNEAALAECDAEMRRFDERISGLRDTLARIEQRKAGQERIADLKAQQKNLAAELERLERELHLTEEFIRAKVAMLEERINSRFKLARFKLFDVQVNGAVAECCDTTYNGVPWLDMNGAAKVNVGLDIINALAEHHGFAPPIIIDERESVTEIIPVEGQVISLLVSPQDKILRVVKNKEVN